jgi:hypothetical protein
MAVMIIINMIVMNDAWGEPQLEIIVKVLYKECRFVTLSRLNHWLMTIVAVEDPNVTRFLQDGWVECFGISMLCKEWAKLHHLLNLTIMVKLTGDRKHSHDLTVWDQVWEESCIHWVTAIRCLLKIRSGALAPELSGFVDELLECLNHILLLFICILFIDNQIVPSISQYADWCTD